MKCETRVLYRPARHKGSGKPYQKAIRWYHSAVESTQIPLIEQPDLVVCQGKIAATVRAYDEPDWGGSYATLEVAYKCDTCGASVFPHLPTTAEALSEFVTRAIEAL